MQEGNKEAEMEIPWVTWVKIDRAYDLKIYFDLYYLKIGFW